MRFRSIRNSLCGAEDECSDGSAALPAAVAGGQLHGGLTDAELARLVQASRKL
jgi:hypothetical protein